MFKRIERDLEHASSYEEWSEAAKALDRRNGKDRWAKQDESRDYDFKLIRSRLETIRAFRRQQDNEGLLFHLNEGIHGNMGGMGRSALYEKARFGTKQLIIEYVDEIVSALKHLARPGTDDVSREAKLDFFHRADHCFGRTAFMMSGSGSLLYFHMGVARTLLQQDLMPGILSGSSGGAFVGSLMASYNDEQLLDMLKPSTLAELADAVVGTSRRDSRFRPSVMPHQAIVKIVETMVPDLTFQEALEHTGRHLNISIAAVETHQKSRLLNAITSPNVFLRESVLASSAVPGVYPPVTLAARNHKGQKQPYLPARKWVDGSVSDDMPAKRLARLYGVNHYVVSQTNPHVLPFVTDGKRPKGTRSIIRDANTKTARAWINAGAATFEKPLSISPALKRASNLALSVINQDYIGDINIMPDSRFFNPFRVLAFLTEKEIRELFLAGERSTWPKVEMIRIQTRISRCLDEILSDLHDGDIMHIRR